MNPDELQRVVALARIVLQVDGIPGREPYATSHLVSTEDLHASVTVPTTPDAPWRIELSEADTDLLAGEGATDTAALADLRAKVEVAAETVVAAIGESLACLRGVRPGKRRAPSGINGRGRPITREEVTDALRAAHGNMAGASRILKCCDRSVGRWVANDPALWPEGVNRLPPGNPGRFDTDGRRTSHDGAAYPKHRYSDAEITDALRQSGGNILRAAKALGCTDACIGLRLKRNPALMPDGLVARKRGRPSLVANDGDKAVA